MISLIIVSKVAEQQYVSTAETKKKARKQASFFVFVPVTGLVTLP